MMVNSALGKIYRKNLICHLLMFLNSKGFCFSVYRERKYIVKEITFWPDKRFKFHRAVFKGTCVQDIFKVEAFHVYEIFVPKNLNLQQQRH